MEVACNKCGAKYQFDASAIPANGYDAQCTTCGSVFFVSPAPAEPPPVSITCVHCGAVYQFPASAIPASGYDAQCTQCSNVFFVSPQGAAAAAPPSPPIVTPPSTPSAPEPQPMPLGPPKVVAETAPVVLTAKAAPPVEPPVAAAPVAAPSEPAASAPGDEPDDDLADMMRLSKDLGVPAPALGGTAEADFEKIMSRRKQRRRVIGIVLGVVVGYTVLTYFAVPRLFDLTLGRLVNIKLTVNPEAVPLMEKGLARMLADTDLAYAGAIQDLEAALAIDAAYPEAVALAVLCHVFRGSDMQAQGRALFEAGARATAQLKTYDELPLTARTADLAKRIEELRVEASRAATESSKLFETGGNEISAAQSLLRPAINNLKHSALLTAAAGIYYTTDPDAVSRAQEMLRVAVELGTGANATLDLDHPPDAWTPLLQGLVRAATKGSEEEARIAFESAVRAEPRLIRAKAELMRLLDRQGRLEEARKTAREILAQVPDHPRARSLLERKLDPPSTPAATVTAPKDGRTGSDAASKGKKAKTKRKR